MIRKWGTHRESPHVHEHCDTCAISGLNKAFSNFCFTIFEPEKDLKHSEGQKLYLCYVLRITLPHTKSDISI